MSLFRALVQVIMAISTVRSTLLCCVFALRGNTDMLWKPALWDVNTRGKKKKEAGSDEQPRSKR